MLFFADASTPDAASMSSWIGNLFYAFLVIGSGVGILAGWRTFNPTPTKLKQPVEVKPAAEYPTRADCEERHRRLEQELSHDRLARKAIYERLERQGNELATVKNETSQQTTSLAHLKTQIEKTNERIDAVPGRVISLLRDTKGLIE